jgi:hypothetical protein
MTADSIENVISYLVKLGIKAKNEQNIEGSLNRVIEFEIEGRVYFIEWWINQSYFKLVNEFSTPKMPFKFINVNDCSPTTLHKYELCFYDEKKANKNDFIYNEIPFGAFRIPFN